MCGATYRVTRDLQRDLVAESPLVPKLHADTFASQELSLLKKKTFARAEARSEGTSIKNALAFGKMILHNMETSVYYCLYTIGQLSLDVNFPHGSRHLTKSAWELVNGPNLYRNISG